MDGNDDVDINEGSEDFEIDDGEQSLYDDEAEVSDSGAQGHGTGAPGGTPSTHRTTCPYLTKYEKARIIGVRALQLSLNAPPTVPFNTAIPGGGGPGGMAGGASSNSKCASTNYFSTNVFPINQFDPIEIAERELYARTLPFKVRRHQPNGDYEEWKLDEMIID